MKRLPLIVCLACATVVLAVEEPPAELLKDLEFFKSLDLIEQDVVMVPLAQKTFDVQPSTLPVTMEESQ